MSKSISQLSGLGGGEPFLLPAVTLRASFQHPLLTYARPRESAVQARDVITVSLTCGETASAEQGLNDQTVD